MFTTLIVSSPRPGGAWRRQLPSTTLSMAAHAVILYAAVIATMPSTPLASGGKKDTTIVYIPDQTPPEPTPPTLPQHFQTLAAPLAVPTSIPPIDPNVTFDPGAYSGIGVAVGPTQDVNGAPDMTQVFIEAAVDEPPVRIAFPPPAYPRMLLDARIEGTVVLEAVIDTLGHPEPASIKVIMSTNRAFESAAREAMRRALYQPGRVQGHRVRVLVQQPVRFMLPK